MTLGWRQRPHRLQRNFSVPIGGSTFSVPYDTLDGQRFVVLSQVAPPTRPLKVVLNWPVLLKR